MHVRSLSVASHKPCEVCSELVESVVDFGVIIGSDIYALAVLQLLTAGEITFHPCKLPITITMDLEQFTSEGFNPITYLNQLLPPSNPDTYYASVTTSLPGLELLARNIHSDLDNSLTGLVRTSSRLGIDMDTLTHDTQTLEAKLPQIGLEIAGLQLESGAMNELALLEVVQERMQQTLETLKKAGQWTTQMDESLRFQIDSGGYEVAEQRIAELRELVGV